MGNSELIKDINLLLRYFQLMRDTQDEKELNRYHIMCKKKLDEVYKGRKVLMKARKKRLKMEKKVKKQPL